MSFYLITFLALAAFAAQVQAGSLGSNKPAITLSNSVAGSASVTLTVSLTPATTTPVNGKVVITLVGSGITLASSPAPTVTITTPSSATGTASLAGMVLTVTLTAGTFNGGSEIAFTISGFTNPSSAQSALTNIAAATTNAAGSLLDVSAAGAYPQITATVTTNPGSTATNPNATNPVKPGATTAAKSSASSFSSSVAILLAAFLLALC